MRSPTNSRKYLVAVSVCAGLIAGVSAGALLQISTSRRIAVSSGSSSNTAREDRAMADTSNRLIALEREMSRLREARWQESSRQFSESEGLAEPVSTSAPEHSPASEQKLLETWNHRVSAHESEPTDPVWAAQAVVAFQRDLNRISGQLGFRVLKTDCRSSGCASSLEFASYDDAKKHFQPLLHAQYELNCGTEILLPEPQQERGPYQATILYRCDDS
jgi:hypothetical protein